MQVSKNRIWEEHCIKEARAQKLATRFAVTNIKRSTVGFRAAGGALHRSPGPAAATYYVLGCLCLVAKPSTKPWLLSWKLESAVQERAA